MFSSVLSGISNTAAVCIFTEGNKSLFEQNKKTKSEGCYIATMVYGDYDHSQVLVLRKLRDDKLLTNIPGRIFVKLYYWTSPKLVKILQNHKLINIVIRKILDGFIYMIE